MADKNNSPVLTTLCYLERDGKYLMLHRTKKEHDINKDKYIGIGGHFEFGESPDECLVREAMEETGLTLTSYRARGIVTFIYGIDEETYDGSNPAPLNSDTDVINGDGSSGQASTMICEYMHLYTADGWYPASGDSGTTGSLEFMESDCMKHTESGSDSGYVSNQQIQEPEILPDCNEGDLVWIDKRDVYDLPVWEGDKIFFRLLEEDRDFFSLKLVYSEDGELKEAILDGKQISIDQNYD